MLRCLPNAVSSSIRLERQSTTVPNTSNTSALMSFASLMLFLAWSHARLIDRLCRGRYPYANLRPHSNQNNQEAPVAEATSTAKTIDLDVPDNEVLYSARDRVATITLNRPERMNATNLTLPYSVSRGMLQAANDPEIRVIVL